MWANLKTLSANHPVFTHIGTLVLAICAFLIYLALTKPAPPIQQPQGPLVVAPLPPGKPGKVVERIIEKAVPVPGPKEIIYLDKPALGSALKMPELAFVHDNVIAVATVAPHRGNTTAIATIGPGADNVYRGGILLRQEKIPFWGLEREWHGGVWYGVAGRNVIHGELEFIPLRTGPVYPSIKGIAGLESDGNLNGQLLLGVRF